MLRLAISWIPLLLIVAAGTYLRVRDLDLRPMHADEANQAVKAGQLLESGHYRYDPTDHHGPVLYYAVVPVARLRGERTLAGLSETSVRLVPAIVGALGILLLGILARPLGSWPALAAAGFLALSPPAVYYSRYFVQETLLATLTLAAAGCFRSWWRSGRLTAALGTGALLGLMQSTKASAPLFAGAAVLAWLLTRPGRPQSSRTVRDLLLAAAIATVVVALFHSSFGANPQGVGDALRAYTSAWARVNDGAGHEKPWYYFLTLFAWRQDGGVAVHQILFTLLAIAGALVAFSEYAPRLLRWAAGYTALILVLLSIPSYKTPWHAIHLVPGLAILAAGALAAIASVPRLGIVGAMLGALVCFEQGNQINVVVFRRPADDRNPYAYVHAVPDVAKYRALAEAALARSPGTPVRIISEEVWPLPWYLRGLPRIGYWNTVPDDCDGALVIASAGLADAVQTRLRGRYETRFLGLRPGFVCIVFTPVP